MKLITKRLAALIMICISLPTFSSYGEIKYSGTLNTDATHLIVDLNEDGIIDVEYEWQFAGGLATTITK